METNRGRHLTWTSGLCTYILTCEAHREGDGEEEEEEWEEWGEEEEEEEGEEENGEEAERRRSSLNS